MRVIGYLIHGNKEYIAFCDASMKPGNYKITDGFHDRRITEKNRKKFVGYVGVKKESIDITKIYMRMKKKRPWHPLINILKKEHCKKK